MYLFLIRRSTSHVSEIYSPFAGKTTPDTSRIIPKKYSATKQVFLKDISGEDTRVAGQHLRNVSLLLYTRTMDLFRCQVTWLILLFCCRLLLCRVRLWFPDHTEDNGSYSKQRDPDDCIDDKTEIILNYG